MTAAAARKLQKEIESTLKKVDEGTDEFSSLWEQATSASSGTQKEKLGEDLKKSINKLQRLRVQIREWIGASDVKNVFKDKLDESRKSIESDMKRFKEFERDMKTKAYSSNALARADDMDPGDVEKYKCQEFVMTSIQTMSEHLEEFEADLEALENKKSLSSDDKERIETIKTMQERHQWHTKKLEMILRGLDNDTVDLGELATIRECVEVYLEMYQDLEYPHDEALYDELDLHAYEAPQEEPISRTPGSKVEAEKESTPTADVKPKAKEKDKKKKEKDERKDKKKDEKSSKAITPTATPTASVKSGGKDAKEPAKDSRILGSPADDEECKVQADQLLLGGEAEEFVCKICQTHVVGCGPTLTNCSHLFCGDCLGQWFAAHPDNQSWAQRAKAAGPERVVPCPVCKQPLNEKRDLYPVCGATSRSENLLLWRMLSSLKIMCINHSRMKSDGKCEWIGEYGQYQKHIKACERGEYVAAASPTAACIPASSSPSTPVAAPVRPAPEPRREEAPAINSQQEAEKSPVPSLSHSTAAPAPAAPAKQPSPKAESSPKAAASPVAAPQQLQPARATPVNTPKVESKPATNAGYSQAAEPVAQAPEAAPKVQQEVAKAPVQAPAAAASSPQPQQQPAASATAQALPQPQSRKAVEKAQDTPSPAPDSFVAQATSAFEPNGANMVAAKVGDEIEVLERHASGWSYCRNLTQGGPPGWAPSWIVQLDAAEEARRKVQARAKEQEARANPAPAPAPAATATVAAVRPAQSKPQELSAAVSAQQTANRAELHRSSQQAAALAPAPAPAPAPQAAPQAASPVAPKAPSTVVRAASASFQGTSSSQLSVNTGDLVEIVESHASGWTYGRKVHTPASYTGPVEGWFPDWVCAQK